jgi:hypothetical protein
MDLGGFIESICRRYVVNLGEYYLEEKLDMIREELLSKDIQISNLE